MYYEEETIKEVARSNDLVELAREYTNLKESGKEYKGLCPFHRENTPSFHVNPHNQLYHCFGCGVGGNIYEFLMEIEGYSFPKAVERLADRANIKLPENQDDESYEEYKEKKDNILEIHQLAQKFFKSKLEKNNKAYQYLKNRGFNNDIIDKFQIGFAPDSFNQLLDYLNNKGFDKETIKASGLISNKKDNYYDRFRNRVMFPIFNQQQEVIAYGGRVLNDDKPKYLNSPDTLIFNKRKLLYPINITKKHMRHKNEAIIFEGYTDVITAFQYNIKNVVASLGTALTQGQANLLKRYVDKVFIAYDSDTAGAKATLRGLDILKEAGLKVKVIRLPQGKDPDDFIKEEGKEGFENLKEESLALVQFKINQILKGKNKEDIDDKVTIVNEVIPVLAKIENSVELNEYINVIANFLNIESFTIKNELNKFKRKNKEEYKGYYKVKKEDLDNITKKNYQNACQSLFKLMLDNKNYIQEIKNKLSPQEFEGEVYKKIYKILLNYYEDNKNIKIEEILNNNQNKDIQNILSAIVFGDSDFFIEENKTEDIIEDFIRRIKNYSNLSKKEQLDKKIKIAEKEGDFNKMKELLQKYQNIINNEHQKGDSYV